MCIMDITICIYVSVYVYIYVHVYKWNHEKLYYVLNFIRFIRLYFELMSLLIVFYKTY